MQYQNYKNKLIRITEILRKIRHFRVLICACLAALFALIIAFLGTKGIVYDVEFDNPEIVYGQSVDASSKALFSKPSYEYKSTSGGDWSQTPPTEPGEYKIRAVGVSGFGQRRYSDEFTFTIAPKEILIKVSESEIEYGKELTLSGDTEFNDKITCEAYEYGDYTKDKTTVEPILDKIKITNSLGKDVTSSYVITTEETNLTFIEKNITVTVESVTQKYDGGVLSSQKYEISEGSVIKGDSLIATFVAEQNGVGTQTNTPSLVIMNADSIDVTEHYNISLVSGTLTVEKRPIIIHTNGGKWTYDGLEHKNEEYTVDSKTKLVDGHTITLVGSTTIVAAGESKNLLSFKITDANGEDVTRNYAINATESVLTIEKRPITIETPTDEWEYDGVSHSRVEAIDKNSALLDGNTIRIDTDTRITDVGSRKNEAIIRILNGTSDVTKNYEITYEYGTLTVTKRPISYLSDSNHRVYDATPYKIESGYITSGFLANGHKIKPTFVGTQTDVGSSENKYEMHILDANGKDVTHNYDVTSKYGTITVDIRNITIESLSASHEYDAKAFTYEGFDVISEYGIVSSHTVKFSEKSSIITVGDTPNILRIQIYEGTKDKSSNYNISYVDTGVLTVTKRQLSVTANTSSAVYTGKPYSDKGYTLGLSGLAQGQKETVSIVGSQTLAIDGSNSSLNVVASVKITDSAGDDVTSNYEIYKYDGILTVNKRPIVFVSSDASKIYDGKALTKSSSSIQPYSDVASEIKALYKEGEYGLAQNEEFTAFYTGSQTVAIDGINSSPNYFSVVITKTTSYGYEATEDNYDIHYIYGTLTVEKRPVIYLSGSDSKVYDGTALTKESFALSKDSKYDVVLDHVAVPTYAGTQTNAGTSDNEYTVAIYSGYDDVSGNYDITCQKGKLTVEKRSITLLSGSNSKIYDGTPIKNETYTLSPNSLFDVVSGEIVTPTFETGIKAVGTGKNVFTVVIDKLGGEPSSDNYNITYEYGSFEITHRPIEVISATDTKKYDGTPLYSYDPIYLTGAIDEGLASNQRLTADITAKITFFGEVKNAIGEVVIKDASGEDVTSNYIVAKTEGTLSITKRELTITVDDKTKVYDGTPLIPDSVTDGADGLATYLIEWSMEPFTDLLLIELSGSQTNVGTSNSDVIEYRIEHASGEDATESYELIAPPMGGTLEVTPRYITVTADSDSKVYDDTPLTKPSSTVTEGSLAPNQTKHETFIGSITDVGSVPNVIDTIVIKDAQGEDVTFNYVITRLDGTLTIEKRHVIFLSGSDTKPYDGTPLIKDTCEVIDLSPYNLVSGHTYEASSFASITLVGKINNTYEITIFKGERDVSANYEIEKTYGTLEITPLKLILTTGSDSKIYDGTPLTDDRYNSNEDEILPFGHTLIVTMTGSQTLAGKSDNTAEWRVENELGEDVSSCFYLDSEISKWGTLEVTKKPIMISTGGKSKVYDRTPLTYSYWICQELDEINAMNHTLIVDVTGTITLPGKTANTLTYQIYNENGENVNDCFEVTYFEGVLEVTIAPIEVITESGQATYTGQPFRYRSAKLSDDSIFPDEYSIKYDFTGSITNVTPGGVPNTVEVKIYDENNQDITERYEPFITYTLGTLEIIPRDMEITAGSAVKELDGLPLYAPLEIKTPNDDFDLLNGYNDDYQFTWEVILASGMLDGTRKDETESSIVEIRIFLNGEEVSNDNFNFTFLPGTLKIVEKIIYVNLYTITGSYNGTPWCFEDGDYWYDPAQFPTSGYYIDIDIEGIGMAEAGTLDLDELKTQLVNEGRIHVIDPNGDDVTDSFEIMFTDLGGITVNPRKIVIKAGSAQKVYDGKELTTTSYEIIQGSLLTGHKIVESSFMISGSQTDVGTSETTVQKVFVTIIDESTHEDVTSNYLIETQNGVLEVKPAN